MSWKAHTSKYPGDLVCEIETHIVSFLFDTACEVELLPDSFFDHLGEPHLVVKLDDRGDVE